MISDGQIRVPVVAIVVTYNRKKLLIKTIESLMGQTRPCDIIIVDNASTDGTQNALAHSGYLNNEKLNYIRLNENIGGAGGFYYGLKFAFEKGWNWYWLMDDDAEPEPNALEEIMKYANDESDIYGSTAVEKINNGSKLCFPAKVKRYKRNEIIEYYQDLLSIENVSWLPFLGFYLHHRTVKKIGYPDQYFFIRNDDIEYSERAKKNGAKLHLIKSSVIKHPFQPTIPFKLFGKKYFYRTMPAWKVYYEIRNKIILAKRHYRLTKNLISFLGASLQVLFGIIVERNKKDYLTAYLNGLIDGIKSV